MARAVEDRDRALTALALTGGNSHRAAELLDQNNTPVPEPTLRAWRTRYQERYDELRATLAPQIEAGIEHELRSLIIQLNDTETLALQRLHEQLAAGQVKDVAGALRNIATTKGINVDKLLTITGRPSSIIETRNAEDLIRRLETLKVKAITANASEQDAAPFRSGSDLENARPVLLPAGQSEDTET